EPVFLFRFRGRSDKTRECGANVVPASRCAFETFELRILRQDVVSGLGHRYRVGRPIHRQIGLMRIPTAPRFRMAPRARRIATEKWLRWLRDIGNSLMRPRILQDMKDRKSTRLNSSHV